LLAVFFIVVDDDEVPILIARRDGSRAATAKRVYDQPVLWTKKLNEEGGELNRKNGRMPFVFADKRYSQYVRRKNFIPMYPTRDIPSKAATICRIVPLRVVSTKTCETTARPVPDWPPYCIEINIGSPRGRKMEAILPPIAQAAGPETRHRVGFMPNIIVDRIPASLAKRLNCIPNVTVTSSVNDLILNVEDKTSVRV